MHRNGGGQDNTSLKSAHITPCLRANVFGKEKIDLWSGGFCNDIDLCYAIAQDKQWFTISTINYSEVLNGLQTMSNYVYILSNKVRTVIYVGVTSNLVRRLEQHTTDKRATAFTAKYNVHDLVYYEKYDSIAEAISREKQIKGWKRERKNKIIDKHNPEWKTLDAPCE